jgi:carboxyl-terminal processing protease
MSSFWRPRARFASFVVAALVVGLWAGCVTYPEVRVSAAQYPAATRRRVEQNLAVFERVWDLVNRKHYEPKTRGIDWEKVAAMYGPRAAAATDDVALYATLNEMLGLLHDSHTHALRPAQAAVRRTHERARTGFAMNRVEQRWIVTEVMPDSPAAVAGVQPGWIVVARDGIPLGERPDYWPTEGQENRWEFIDQHDRPVVLALRAQRLSTAPLQVVRPLPGGFVYLRFDGFDLKDRQWLGRQLREHASAPGVVIDLRRNPGGETFSLGITIGEFFDRAVDCGTFVTRNGARSVKNSWQLGSARYHGRVVVLVDAATASAAEIFAAVLKDHGRARIVGRATAGAVLASWFYSLPDGGELQLSREDYIAPNGRRIEGSGIEPDVVVTRTLADVRAGRDRDLEVALQLLNEAR